MNTAEVTIEQLLAGILALLACGLPFADPAAVALLPEAWITGALLGVAYLLGAVFDKLIDTVLGGAEQWVRLRVAAEVKARRAREGADPGDSDPFPQDELEAKLREKEGSAAWMSYLRTRIRLARSLAVLSPLITLSIGAFLLFSQRPELVSPAGAVMMLVPRSAGAWLAALAPALVFVLALICAWVAPPLPRTRDWDYAGGVARPKSDDRARPRVHRVYPRLDRGDEGERRFDDLSERSWLLVAFGPLVAIHLLSLLAGAILQGQLAASFIAIHLAGALLGLLALWSWYRIVTSYMRFVAAPRGE